MSSDASLPHDQFVLVERFLAAYNRIDAELRRRLSLDTFPSFTRVVGEYADKHRYWQEAPRLETYADLRNLITHTSIEAFQRVAIPTQVVVEDIERIEKELDERVFPRFQSDVTTVGWQNSLKDTLAHIDSTGFSQFPVYAGENDFRGLLTENGITRWLARTSNGKVDTIDLGAVTIAAVMAQEEARENVMFVARTTPFLDVREAFVRRPLLEAILITHSGKDTQGLLGIVTRWDMLDE